MSNLELGSVGAYNVLPEVPLARKGCAMKKRPVGDVIARDSTCNLIVTIQMQDPEKGYAMRLSEGINNLAPEQLLKLKELLQERADTLCKEVAGFINSAISSSTHADEQIEIDLEAREEDDLEIPRFYPEN